MLLALGAMAVHSVGAVGGRDLDNFFGSYVFSAIIGAAALGILARAILVPQGRRAWLILAIGMLSYEAGALIWSFWMQYQAQPPYPSVCDALWLALYPASYVSFVMLARSRLGGRFPASVWIDGIVAGLAIASIGMALVFDAVLKSSTGTFAAIATNFAYPFFDIVLAALVMGIFALSGWRFDRSWILLGSGFVLLGIADGLYVNQVADSSYLPGGVPNFFWAAGVALLGFAAWRRPRPTLPEVESRRALAWPLAFIVTSIGLLLYDHFAHLNLLAVLLATATLLMAMVRMGLSFREVSQLADTRRQALTDELTGLANRRMFHQRLNATIAENPDSSLGVLILDLDRFKELNDTLGHHSGDLLLQRIGPRLRTALREGDTLARLGGDEFAILLPGVDSVGAGRAAQNLRAEIERPFLLEGLSLTIDASVGIALFPSHSMDADGLLQRADIAMYEAKEAGAGHQIYAPERDEHSRDRLVMMSQLRDAIDAGELVLHYQPKCDPLTGAISDVEGLVRWEHPKQGLLGPGAFIPMAEQSGLMRPLTLNVLEMALEQFCAWRKRGIDLAVAVNVAAPNLLDLQFPGDVASALTRHGVDPRRIRLEITENAIMADSVRVLEILDKLAELGVGLSLDDFGTGASSLTYLKRLPIDELKLDRSFVVGLEGNPDDAAIVHSTIDLAHRLGLKVVAEGVEDEETWSTLRDLGCDLIQGFHLSRPLPPGQLEELLRARATSAAKELLLQPAGP